MRPLLWFVSLLMVGCATVPAPASAPVSPSTPPAEEVTEQALASSIGIWTYQDLAGNLTARNNFYKFVSTRPVHTIYLEAEYPLLFEPIKLAAFVQDASTRNYKVDLLTGHPHWALPAHHPRVVEYAQKALAFTLQQKAQGKAQPSALHLDVEPYILPEWSSDQQGTANGLIDMMVKVKGVLGSALPLTVDIPCWFDDIPVTRDGVTRPLSEWILDVVDTAVLMDYQDTAQGIINSGYGEIEYAKKVGKKVVLGTNTKCEGAENDGTTFCEEGVRFMEKTLNTVNARYTGEGSYGGLAVFTAEDYKALKR